MYQQYLDSGLNGTSNSTHLYTMGKQLGLGTKLFSLRAMPVKKDYTLFIIIATVSILCLITFAEYVTKKMIGKKKERVSENLSTQGTEEGSRNDDEVTKSVN